MKILGHILVVILTSLFFFPFNTTFLPAVNTKMMLAAVGLVIFLFRMAKKHNAEVDYALAGVSLSAILVSLVSIVATWMNDTRDYTYVSYIVSAWVWIGGAYTVINCIKALYGKATLRILTNVLVAVCVAQCFLSQIIANSEAVANWVDSFMVSTGFMGKVEGRFYGLGCALDVAGLKFCTVQLLLAYFVRNPSKKINVYIETSLYLAAFFIIAIFGSMIARTTSIGTVIVILYWIIDAVYKSVKRINRDATHSFGKTMTAAIVALVPLLIYFYNTDLAFRDNLRFGFEGFFSLFETGEWEVRSNEMLMRMWVWPDNLKTWIIGDGYFNSPDLNPYYVGPSYMGYYMGTDIGYCRFIFYFGVLGLATFAGHFINCARICSKNIPKCKIVFWLIVLMNFVGWIKVSSDLFPIFALILMLGKDPEGQVESEGAVEELEPNLDEDFVVDSVDSEE